MLYTSRNFRLSKFCVLFFLFAALVFALQACGDETVSLPTGTDYCSEIHRNDSLSLTEELAPIAARMQEETAVHVLEDGAGSMVARAWLSEYAEKTIDIQYFIFSLDNVGLIACDYIVRAADRGVKVRILVDDLMVDADIEDVLVLSMHENIELKIYNPGMNLGKNIFSKVKKLTTDFKVANQRMHNKSFVVDGKAAITGGRNIADEYFDYDQEYNFRDRDVLLLGKVTESMNRTFESFWQDSLSVPIAKLYDKNIPQMDDAPVYDALHEYACNPENFSPQVRKRLENLPAAFRKLRETDNLHWIEDVRFVSDVPGKNDTDDLDGGGVCTTELVNLIKDAQESIAIQSPYLITTELGKGLFKAAVDRGVEVRILTNSLASTDNVEAFSAYQKDREALLKTGVRIFEFRPDAAARMELMTGRQSDKDHIPVFGLHAKTMVVDGKTTVIGTFNLDPRSANLNTECVAIIESEKVAAEVLEGIEQEFLPANAWETTLNFNPDSVVGNWKRVKTWTRKVLPKDIL